MRISEIIRDEQLRREMFPVCAKEAYLAHAGVCPLPKAAADALRECAFEGSLQCQESAWSWERVKDAREAAAALLGCSACEIALLGPTSLGLSLVANGLDWRAGDEVIYYRGDYPANVYPWMDLARKDVKPVALEPETPGVITWELVEASLTPRTRLVALASCHFLSGYRIDVEGIGRRLRERDVLFCVDGIQTLGAFPMRVEHVDFLSADSHKWLLGPAGAGIVYVREALHSMLRPSLLGAWNVQSPDYVARDSIDFYAGARRYEPGMLNIPGIIAMRASMRMLLELGIGKIAERLLELRRFARERLRPLGYVLYTEEYDKTAGDDERSAILTLRKPGVDMKAVARRLRESAIAVSLRHNARGEAFVRLSPHFYNTEEEIERVAEVLRAF